MYLKQKTNLSFILFLIVVLFLNCTQKDSPTTPESLNLKTEIDQIVHKYYKVGAAIGVITKQQEQLLFFYGTKFRNRNERPDVNTVFQIGSISKTFTNTLLADRVLKGIVKLEDKVNQYLPSDQVTMPEYEGKEITLMHLATHSSGIPKKLQDTDYPYPSDYNPSNPYAAYTKEHVYDYLTNFCALPAEPGTRYVYSNIGGGLLGHILGIVDGSSYEALLHSEILDPLGMNNTFIFSDEGQDTNIALGYSGNFDVRPNFDANDIFQGAGFIKSSLNDMLIYLKANMGLVETPISEAIALTHQLHFDVGRVTYDDHPNEVFQLTVGLGWHHHQDSDGQTYFWHGGKTNGHTAYIGFNESNMTGVVILCNFVDVDIIIFGEEILKTLNRF